MVINFKSEESRTPFAQTWNYFILENYINALNFDTLGQTLLNKEPEIKNIQVEEKNLTDGGTGLGYDSTTSKYRYYNVLNWKTKEIEQLKEEILKNYILYLELLNIPRKSTSIQCWMNILRKGEEIKPHLHSRNSTGYLSGHVCVTTQNTSTCYANPEFPYDLNESFKSKNEMSKITIFPSFVPHFTTKHLENKERITIAFDIVLSDHLNSDRAKSYSYISFDEI